MGGRAGAERGCGARDSAVPRRVQQPDVFDRGGRWHLCGATSAARRWAWGGAQYGARVWDFDGARDARGGGAAAGGVVRGRGDCRSPLLYNGAGCGDHFARVARPRAGAGGDAGAERALCADVGEHPLHWARRCGDCRVGKRGRVCGASGEWVDRALGEEPHRGCARHGAVGRLASDAPARGRGELLGAQRFQIRQPGVGYLRSHARGWCSGLGDGDARRSIAGCGDVARVLDGGERSGGVPGAGPWGHGDAWELHACGTVGALLRSDWAGVCADDVVQGVWGVQSRRDCAADLCAACEGANRG